MKKYLSLVKFAHTIFALPFAIVGVMYGLYWMRAEGLSLEKPVWLYLVLVVLCMVFARSAAMGFNRYIDRDIDSQNVRTKVREIPAGLISPQNALIFVVINSLLFVATTWFINPLCFFLSPVALVVILGYSFTKRFTALCHLILGLGLSLAPVGAFIAVTGRFEWEPIVLGLVVLTWVAGFDIIYALQDEQFDKEQQLYSIPSLFGKSKALHISIGLHLVSGAMLILFGVLTQGTLLFWIGAGIFLFLLVYQHSLVSPQNLSKVNLAFFTTNGIASVVFAVFTVAELLLRVGTGA